MLILSSVKLYCFQYYFYLNIKSKKGILMSECFMIFSITSKIDFYSTMSKNINFSESWLNTFSLNSFIKRGWISCTFHHSQERLNGISTLKLYPSLPFFPTYMLGSSWNNFFNKSYLPSAGQKLNINRINQNILLHWLLILDVLIVL